MKFDELIQLHLQQPYGIFDKPISIDEVLNKYALFPNEAIYLVDCKQAQMEPLTSNFSKITGIDTLHKNELTPIYEHVHTRDLDAFLKYTTALLKYGFGDTKVFTEEKDFNMNLYRTHNNRVILKSTTILSYDSNNRIRYSIGKLMDVTGLIPFQSFGYKFIGPGSSSLSTDFEDLFAFESILTKRELEVLKHTGAGLSSAQQAKILCISKHTIDTHKRNIIKKLEASNSIEAYNKARAMGLF